MEMPQNDITISRISEIVGTPPSRLSSPPTTRLTSSRRSANTNRSNRRRLAKLSRPLDSRKLGGVLRESETRQGPKRHLAGSERKPPSELHRRAGNCEEVGLGRVVLAEGRRWEEGGGLSAGAEVLPVSSFPLCLSRLCSFDIFVVCRPPRASRRSTSTLRDHLVRSFHSPTPGTPTDRKSSLLSHPSREQDFLLHPTDSSESASVRTMERRCGEAGERMARRRCRQSREDRINRWEYDDHSDGMDSRRCYSYRLARHRWELPFVA